MAATERRWRVFFHYRRQDGLMSVHFRGVCSPAWTIECNVPVKTKRNKRQPYLVMQGMARGVRRRGDTLVIW